MIPTAKVMMATVLMMVTLDFNFCQHTFLIHNQVSPQDLRDFAGRQSIPGNPMVARICE